MNPNKLTKTQLDALHTLHQKGTWTLVGHNSIATNTAYSLEERGLIYYKYRSCRWIAKLTPYGTQFVEGIHT